MKILSALVTIFGLSAPLFASAENIANGELVNAATKAFQNFLNRSELWYTVKDVELSNAVLKIINGGTKEWGTYFGSRSELDLKDSGADKFLGVREVRLFLKSNTVMPNETIICTGYFHRIDTGIQNSPKHVTANLKFCTSDSNPILQETLDQQFSIPGTVDIPVN